MKTYLNAVVLKEDMGLLKMLTAVTGIGYGSDGSSEERAGACNRRQFLRAAWAGGALIVLNPLEALAFHTEAKQLPGKPKPQEPITHPNLTRRIAELYKLHFPETETARDLQTPELLEALIQGSIDEDYPLTNTLQHSWNPSRPTYDDAWQPFGPGIGNDGSKDALPRAQTLFEEARKQYLAGEKKQAYHTLGRVIHLLEDMGSPAHVYLVPHFRLQRLACDNGIFTGEGIERLLSEGKIGKVNWDLSECFDVGDDYETICAGIEMERAIDGERSHKAIIGGPYPLSDLFGLTAKACLDPWQEGNNEVRKLYKQTRSGNGGYTDSRATEEEICSMARAIVPSVIWSGTITLRLWNMAATEPPPTGTREEGKQVLDAMKKYLPPSISDGISPTLEEARLQHKNGDYVDKDWEVRIRMTAERQRDTYNFLKLPADLQGTLESQMAFRYSRGTGRITMIGVRLTWEGDNLDEGQQKALKSYTNGWEGIPGGDERIRTHIHSDRWFREAMQPQIYLVYVVKDSFR